MRRAVPNGQTCRARGQHSFMGAIFATRLRSLKVGFGLAETVVEIWWVCRPARASANLRQRRFHVNLKCDSVAGDKLKSRCTCLLRSRSTPKIDAAIDRVRQIVGPDVERIRNEIREDWSGEWAIFFRVVLTDDAARRRLRDVATKVIRNLPGSWVFLPSVSSCTTISEVSQSRQLCRNRRGPSG